MLLHLSKLEVAVGGLIRDFGVEYFITCFQTLESEVLQRQVLRLLRNIAETGKAGGWHNGGTCTGLPDTHANEGRV